MDGPGNIKPNHCNSVIDVNHLLLTVYEVKPGSRIHSHICSCPLGSPAGGGASEGAERLFASCAAGGLSFCAEHIQGNFLLVAAVELW